MGYSAVASIIIGNQVHQNQENQVANQRAGARLRQFEEALKAGKEGAISDADNARRQKQMEELSRQGRRASILTSAGGLDEQLGDVGRPQARASALLGG